MSAIGTVIKKERITRILEELAEGLFNYTDLSERTSIKRPSLQSLMLPLIAEGKIVRISAGNGVKFKLPGNRAERLEVEEGWRLEVENLTFGRARINYTDGTGVPDFW